MTIQLLTLRREPWTVCPLCNEMIDSLDRCGCDYKRSPEEAPAEGYDLDLFPWEDAAAAIAEAEAIFEEMETKPGLGVDDGYDPSLDFDMLLAEVQATGGWTSPVAATLFEEEHVGLHFARHPWQY